VQDKSLRDYNAAHRKLGEATVEIERLITWLPIKTAPKNADRLLIGWFTPSGHGLLSSEWNTRCAWWDKSEKAWTDNAVDSWGYEEVQKYKPTHWMNVPAAPST
jgi:hypothetical protein